MLSRSSSAYQPLDSAAGMNGGENSSQRKGTTKGNGETSGGNETETEPDIHEMTSIAVISQNPLGSGATPTISTLPMAKANEPGGTHTQGGTAPEKRSKLDRMGAKQDSVAVDIDFTKRRNMSDKSGWTNFHFVMCIGILGFFIFWVFILCRMYLPPEYQFMNPQSPFYTGES